MAKGGFGSIFGRLIGRSAAAAPIAQVVDDAAKDKTPPRAPEDDEMASFADRANAMDDARQP